MAELASKQPLGADNVDPLHSVHKSQAFARESHLRLPHVDALRQEAQGALDEETPKAAPAKKEDMRMDGSLGAAAMAVATLSSGAGTAKATRNGQPVLALELEKDGDTKTTSLPEAASAVEGLSHSVTLGPGERIPSLSHLLEDRLSLVAPRTTAALIQGYHPSEKHARQPSKSFTIGGATGQESRSASYAKDERRDHPCQDRRPILDTQIPKKGRPISRHTPSSSQSNAQSTSIAGAAQPRHTHIRGGNAGSWTSSSGTRAQQAQLQSPSGGHGMWGVAGQQSSVQSERITNRPKRVYMSVSSAPHMHPQMYCGQQPGSFLTAVQTHVPDSAEGSRLADGLFFRSIAPGPPSEPTATATAHQYSQERYSPHPAHSSDHHQPIDFPQLRYDRPCEVAPFSAHKYEEAEHARTAGMPFLMNGRKRNSTGVEKRRSISDYNFDKERRSDGSDLEPYDPPEEDRRASKRTSRSDLNLAGTGERSSLNKAGSHQRRPRSMVLTHGYDDPALRAREGLELEKTLHYRSAYGNDERSITHETTSVSSSRFLHSQSRSLDMSHAMTHAMSSSLRLMYGPRSSDQPVPPTSSRVDSYLSQRPCLNSVPSATAHPGRPNPSVPLVSRVTAVPSMSHLSFVPAVTAVTGDAMLKRTDHHPHASPSSLSLSSSYDPSPTATHSPRFEPSTGPTLVNTSATASSFITTLNSLSSSHGSLVSVPSSRAGCAPTVLSVQSHQDHISDDKDPTEITLRADRLAREMSGWSYSALRGRRGTSFGAMRTTVRSTVRKTHGTYLKKHQILQQQLQQLQREQEMDLSRAVRDQRPHQAPEHHPHHQQQHPHLHQHQHQPRRPKEQARRSSHENPSIGLRQTPAYYPPEQPIHQQQPRPGRPPKQRVLMRSQSSAAVVLERSLLASFESGQIEPSPMHHASEVHPPQGRTIKHFHQNPRQQQSQPQPQQQQQQQHQQQQQQQRQRRILLRPVSLPVLARGSTDPSSALFLNQPPLSQPRFQSMHVPPLNEFKEPWRSEVSRGSGAYRSSSSSSSIESRFHMRAAVVEMPSLAAGSCVGATWVSGKGDPTEDDKEGEVIECLSIRTPVSEP